MSLEKFEKMDEGEAHDLANKMRAQLEASPERGGKVEDKFGLYPGGRSLNADEYAESLRQIEEWEKIVAADPHGIEKLKEAFDFLTSESLTTTPVLFAIKAMRAAEESKNMGGEARKDSENEYKFLFSDAKDKLKKLMKEGKKFGDNEIQSDVDQ